jgi:hypothetical protein
MGRSWLWGLGLIVLSAPRSIPTHDGDVWRYAVAGVALLVVGCVLSILATARRTARPSRPVAAEPTSADKATSPSVSRLLRDVRGWTKRR